MEVTEKEIVSIIVDNAETYYKTEEGDLAKVYVYDLVRAIVKLIEKPNEHIIEANHVCKFYVNSNWSGYSRCECGKSYNEKQPKN